MKLKALILASIALSPLAHAASDIMLSHTYARATPPSAATSAVFTEIMNHSAKDRVSYQPVQTLQAKLNCMM